MGMIWHWIYVKDVADKYLETCALHHCRESGVLKENPDCKMYLTSCCAGATSRSYASGRRRLRLPDSSAFSTRSDSIRAGASGRLDTAPDRATSKPRQNTWLAPAAPPNPVDTRHMEHLGRHSSDAQIESYRPLPRPFAAICHPRRTTDSPNPFGIWNSNPTPWS